MLHGSCSKGEITFGIRCPLDLQGQRVAVHPPCSHTGAAFRVLLAGAFVSSLFQKVSLPSKYIQKLHMESGCSWKLFRQFQTLVFPKNLALAEYNACFAASSIDKSPLRSRSLAMRMSNAWMGTIGCRFGLHRRERRHSRVSYRGCFLHKSHFKGDGFNYGRGHLLRIQ